MPSGGFLYSSFPIFRHQGLSAQTKSEQLSRVMAPFGQWRDNKKIACMVRDSPCL